MKRRDFIAVLGGSGGVAPSGQARGSASSRAATGPKKKSADCVGRKAG
jgi:hypothetical protein